jgi:hypothetical protein
MGDESAMEFGAVSVSFSAFSIVLRNFFPLGATFAEKRDAPSVWPKKPHRAGPMLRTSENAVKKLSEKGF